MTDESINERFSAKIDIFTFMHYLSGRAEDLHLKSILNIAQFLIS